MLRARMSAVIALTSVLLATATATTTASAEVIVPHEVPTTGVSPRDLHSARALLRRARTAVRKRRLDMAQRLAEAAWKRAPLASAAIVLGRIHKTLSTRAKRYEEQRAEARRAFRWFLTARTVDTRTAAQTSRAIDSGLQRSGRRANTGALAVRPVGQHVGDPVAGARVLLDGVPIARWAGADMGKHRVTVSAPGFQTQERDMSISAYDGTYLIIWMKRRSPTKGAP